MCRNKIGEDHEEKIHQKEKSEENYMYKYLLDDVRGKKYKWLGYCQPGYSILLFNEKEGKRVLDGELLEKILKKYNKIKN
jgi:hypothetical protein